MESFCSHCGSPLVERVIEGRLRPVCPACGRVDYRQLKVGAGVLLQCEDRLLLLRRSDHDDAFPGAWNLPAGYCEADEDPAAAAAREATEETGMAIRMGRFVDAYYYDDDPRGSGLLLVYEAALDPHALPAPSAGAGAFPILPQPDERRDDVAVGAFFSPGELPGPLAGGGHDRAIRAWQARALDRWQPGMPMRYCPHCAHPLETRQAGGRERPVCPACGFIHFRDPKVGASALAEQDGRLLLVQRGIEPGLGRWALPAGYVEWDEAPEAAVCRECEEETGLTVVNPRLVDVLHFADDFRGPGINLVYRVEIVGGQLRPGDDARSARFFAPGELPPPQEIAFRNHRLVVKRWRTERQV